MWSTAAVPEEAPTREQRASPADVHYTYRAKNPWWIFLEGVASEIFRSVGARDFLAGVYVDSGSVYAFLQRFMMTFTV